MIDLDTNEIHIDRSVREALRIGADSYFREAQTGFEIADGLCVADDELRAHCVSLWNTGLAMESALALRNEVNPQ